MPGPIYNCLKWAMESWPVVRTGFKNGLNSVWEETEHAVTKDANPFMARVFAPDVVYNSDLGKSLVKPMLDADADFKMNYATKFIREHEDILKKIDPTWQGAAKEDFSQEISDTWTKYIKGDVKTEDIPFTYRNSLAKLKSYVKDNFDQIPALRKAGPMVGGIHTKWELNDDLTSGIMRLTDKNNPNPGMFGLIRVVPKEIPYKIIEQENLKGISGVDLMRFVAPMLERKKAFDPVIDKMREAIPQLGEVERAYTQKMIERLVGKKTSMEESIDLMIHHVGRLMGREIKFSPSARYSAGLTKSFFDGAIAYNPSTALLNLTQTIFQASRDRLMPTIKAFAKSKTASGRFLNAERIALGDLDKFAYRNMDQSALKQGKEKFLHIGYSMFNGGENLMRGMGFHAGLGRFMQENNIKSLEDFIAMREGSESAQQMFIDGMRRGQESAAETYFMYSTVHQSPYLSSPLAKLAFQFTSFPLRATEMMIKQIRQKNYMFFPRFLAYTGAASGVAYYGMGSAIGNQMGGAGSWPIAKEYIDKGDFANAAYAVAGGFIRQLAPDPHSIARGLSPAGGLLVDTLSLPLAEHPEEAWAKWGRSASLVFPAGLEIRRLAEAGMTAWIQHGERHTQEGLAQGLSFPTLVSGAAKEVFGKPVPGISPRFTGDLIGKEEFLSETAPRALGLRTRKAEEEFRFGRDETIENKDIKDKMTETARGAAAALLNGTPEEFSTAIEAAMKSGVFTSSRALNQSIESALQRQLLTDKERFEKRSPKAAKIRRALE